jgi:hypothetical protein
MMLSVAGTQLVGLAVELGLADLLNDGPEQIGTLAMATGAREQALLQVMRARAELGVFAESQPGLFANTSIGVLLRAGIPNSLRGYALFVIQQDDASRLGQSSAYLQTILTLAESASGQRRHRGGGDPAQEP